MMAQYAFTGKVAGVLICYSREKFALATTRQSQVNQAGVSTSTVNHAFVNY